MITCLIIILILIPFWLINYGMIIARNEPFEWSDLAFILYGPVTTFIIVGIILYSLSYKLNN